MHLARAHKTKNEKAKRKNTARKVIQKARKQRGHAKGGDLPPALDASTANQLTPML